MARNTRRTGKAARARLTQRGIGAVAVVAGVLVIAAFNGYAGPAALTGYSIYLLVSGKAGLAVRALPDAKQVFRGLCWLAVAGAALLVVQGATAPGGPTLGVALAVALAVALKLTSRNTRR
jgi:hypothetical protein